jgi:hypothetical protein
MIVLSYLAIDDPLPVYAANLLAAFRDLKINDNGSLFVVFVFRSCLPEITHRLGADLYAFNHPVEEILNGWSPIEPIDVLTPKRVHLKSDYPILRPLLANVLVAGTDNQYEWSIGTAPVWIAALCRVIKEAKDSARKCRHPDRSNNTIDPDALDRLILASSSLHFLSFGIPTRQLLSLNSIRVALNRHYKYSVDDSTTPDDGNLIWFQCLTRCLTVMI